MEQQVEVLLQGHLPPVWADVFDDLQVSCLPEGTTRIAGSLPDQAALYGLMMRLRDFGMTLISVRVQAAQDVK